MSKDPTIRCDKWMLAADADLVRMVELTTGQYRRMTKAVSGLLMVHWPKLANATMPEIEKLFHRTKDNPEPKYGDWFDRQFAKFPSYLRRAAVNAAMGHVSSFMTRYQSWQAGQRSRRDARPPAWGQPNHNPVLYAANGGAGAMIRYAGDTVSLKLWSGTDWIWKALAVVRKGTRHAGECPGQPISPSLMVAKGRVHLAVPFEMPKWCRLGNREVVCSADLGINTDVVASIVANDGTVVARSFIDRASHIDRRDRGLASIRSRARQTMGGRPCASKIGDNAGMQPLADFIGQAGRLDADPEATEKLLSKASRGTQGSTAGRLSDGFCRKAYRRARGLNLQVARDLARELIAFAVKHGARVIVFEDLKGFRPRGGRRGSTMRQRFHGWLHRLLVRQVTSTFVERGGKVATVYARGTSSYAYDGSGKVRRQSWNRALTVFANGRHYNADLNASYNIGARWWVQEWRKVSAAAKRAVDAVLTPCPSTAPSSKLPLASRKAGETFPGRSSRKVPRMPVTLSSLWRLVEVLEGEKLQLCPRA